MTADFIPFDFENITVRAVMRGEDPWFVAIDVCRALEIKDMRVALSWLDDDEIAEADAACVEEADRLPGKIIGGQFTLKVAEFQQRCGMARCYDVVSESGLYRILLTGDTPQCRAFRGEMADFVLPALRKNGRFQL